MGQVDASGYIPGPALPHRNGKRRWWDDKMVVDGTQCSPNVTYIKHDNFTLDNTTYFYQSCSWRSSEVIESMISCLRRVELYSNTDADVAQCAPFCRSFRDALPHIYGAFSCLSLLCCLGVFMTYYIFPRLQQSGYSSKVFLRRYSMLHVIVSK